MSDLMVDSYGNRVYPGNFLIRADRTGSSGASISIHMVSHFQNGKMYIRQVFPVLKDKCYPVSPHLTRNYLTLFSLPKINHKYWEENASILDDTSYYVEAYDYVLDTTPRLLTEKEKARHCNSKL